ncbi:MAG: hypothetical protein L6R40_003336 [Gallowayella cf. fulva]|nr:MAG: hypothetical protein L6R40_003336 [Xanthomendoza cf. fulva]
MTSFGEMRYIRDERSNSHTVRPEPSEGDQLAREVLDYFQSEYHAALDAGDYLPFVWPHRALGPYLLILYLLIPPTQSPLVYHGRYPLFALIIYLSVTAIYSCRSPAVTVGYGIGLLNAWTILWSASLIIFNDGRRDYKRIERQERPGGASNDQAFVENIQGQTSALDGSTTDELKLLHPVGDLPEPEPEPSITNDITPKFESPEIFDAQGPIPSSASEIYTWQSLPRNFLHRFDFILDLVTNFRGVRWTHQGPGTHPPPPHIRETLTDPETPPSLHPDKYPTYRNLFTSNLQSFILCSLTLDILKYLTSLDPYFLAQGQNTSSPFPIPGTIRLTLSLVFTHTSLLNIFLLAPLVLACTLGPRILGPHASTWLYPPYYGPISQVAEKGLAGLWGGWWHQLFRYAFEAAGEFIGGRALRLSKKSVPGGIVRVVVAFTLLPVLRGPARGHHCATSAFDLSEAERLSRSYPAMDAQDGECACCADLVSVDGAVDRG